MPPSKTRKPRRRKRPLHAAGLLDFRPAVDHVVRYPDGFGYVVDREGLYEPVRVDDDCLDDRIRANLDRLTELQAARMFEVIRLSPHLSPEGKRERMGYLLSTGKVRLQFAAA